MRTVYFIFLLLNTICAAREMVPEINVQEFFRTLFENLGQNRSTEEKFMEKDSMVAGFNFAEGMVSQQCLTCICELESGCRPIGCHMDVGSLSCGYFQIKEVYWTDCGKPGKDLESCANDEYCSSKCVQNFMKRYATRYHCPLDCEGFAREHNGGPNGCKNQNTVAYWHRLQQIPGCRHPKLP